MPTCFHHLTQRALGAHAAGSFVVLLAYVLLATVPSEAWAATFTVNSTADTGDANHADNTCDDGTGKCTLRAALEQADLCGWTAVFNLAVTGTIQGPFAFESPDCDTDVEVNGPGSAALTILGGLSFSGTYPGDAFHITFATGKLVGVTVNGPISANINRGLSLIDVVLEGDVNVRNGGPVTLTNAVASGPLSIEADVGAPFFNVGPILITNSAIADVSVFNFASLTMLGTRVNGSIFIGAAALRPFSGPFVIADSSIQHGGIGIEAGMGDISRCTIANGTGIVVGSVNTGVVRIDNTTVSGNAGAGIASHIPSVLVSDSTIVNNAGGGITGFRLYVSRSIIAGNRDADGNPSDCNTGIYGTGNLIGLTRGCTDLSGMDFAGNLVGVDPRISPLQDNGGPTLTHALLTGSPAIDEGACDSITDQRGVSRPQGGACDIGAYEFACGNGVVDVGEDCDDGNALDGDCCSSACRFDTPGSLCGDDGDACTTRTCDGAGVCGPATVMTCPACEACNPTLGCVAAPKTGCLLPSEHFAAQLSLVRGLSESRDKLVWNWRKGQASAPATFGDPTDSDSLSLCIYDESQATPQVVLKAALPAGDNCDGRPCWKALGHPTGSRGFKRVAHDGAPDGIIKALLKPGGDGKASIRVNGKGELLATPNLPLNLPLLVQLQSEAGACWEARYTSLGLRRNDASQFSGRAF